MARTRRHSHPPPSSSTKNNNNKKKASPSLQNQEQSEEEEDKEEKSPEEQLSRDTTTLDLGTDEETTDEEGKKGEDEGEWQKVKGRRGEQKTTPESSNCQVSNHKSPKIQIEIDDVDEGIEYWSNAIFCYVLGANPPWTVLNGYANRIWQGKGVEQVSFMPNGIFLVRFSTKEAQQEALKQDALIFDNKPVIVEEWTPNATLTKKEIKKVPIWVKLRNLELKFWGDKCFSKLVSGIGKYLEADVATRNRQFLGFAKVKVEVKLDQEFPNFVEFIDEMGQDQLIGVTYDWLPISCEACKAIGHYKKDCRKANTKNVAPRKIWKPKIAPPPTLVEGNTFPSETTTDIMRTPSLLKDVGKDSSDIIGSIISAGRQKERTEYPQDQGFKPGGTSFLEKLTQSIQKDIEKQAEMEAGDSLLNG